jgi:hypothetical protein
VSPDRASSSPSRQATGRRPGRPPTLPVSGGINERTWICESSDLRVVNPVVVFDKCREDRAEFRVSAGVSQRRIHRLIALFVVFRLPGDRIDDTVADDSCLYTHTAAEFTVGIVGGSRQLLVFRGVGCCDVRPVVSRRPAARTAGPARPSSTPAIMRDRTCCGFEVLRGVRR